MLTIGVAADANIVIFERIKEEYRAGKSCAPRSRPATGRASHDHRRQRRDRDHRRVLFLVATAGVKGFALMLLIGTLMSLFTAVIATRAMLGLLAGFNWFDNPKLMGAGASRRRGSGATSSAFGTSGSRSPVSSS